MSVSRAKDLCRLGRTPGQYVVFDPTTVLVNVLRQLSKDRSERPRRRRFTSAYKLAVLNEYERATDPGAKSELLRREGLHTSHLVLWRRASEAGKLLAD